MSHAYIQLEDLGLTVLGTTQYGYTVNGVHGQDFDTAVFRAALCRSVGVEGALAAYNKLVAGRQAKLDDLGSSLALVNEALAKPEKLKTTTKINIGSKAVKLLKNCGITSVIKDSQRIDVGATMEYQYVVLLQQEIQYALDREDNEAQQDMSTMQNFLTKRDDAMKMASKLMKKVAQTRARGIENIGG